MVRIRIVEWRRVPGKVTCGKCGLKCQTPTPRMGTDLIGKAHAACGGIFRSTVYQHSSAIISSDESNPHQATQDALNDYARSMGIGPSQWLPRLGDTEEHSTPVILRAEAHFAWSCDLPGFHLGTDMLDYVVLYPDRYEMCPDCEASFKLAAGEKFPEHAFNSKRCAMSRQPQRD